MEQSTPFAGSPILRQLVTLTLALLNGKVKRMQQRLSGHLADLGSGSYTND